MLTTTAFMFWPSKRFQLAPKVSPVTKMMGAVSPAARRPRARATLRLVALRLDPNLVHRRNSAASARLLRVLLLLAAQVARLERDRPPAHAHAPAAAVVGLRLGVGQPGLDHAGATVELDAREEAAHDDMVANLDAAATVHSTRRAWF